MEKKIGQSIKERIKAANMNVTSFAAAIGTERTNAYDIFSRDSIDTALLKKIGHVLNYDFFFDLIEEKTIELLKEKRDITNTNEANEPPIFYGKCAICAEKDKQIKLLEKYIDRLELDLGTRRTTV